MLVVVVMAVREFMGCDNGAGSHNNGAIMVIFHTLMFNEITQGTL